MNSEFDAIFLRQKVDSRCACAYLANKFILTETIFELSMELSRNNYVIISGETMCEDFIFNTVMKCLKVHGLQNKDLSDCIIEYRYKRIFLLPDDWLIYANLELKICLRAKSNHNV